MINKVEVSTDIVWRTILILLFLGFLFLIRDVLFLLLLAIVVVSAALPVVDRLEIKKIPRAVSALFLYLSFLVFFGFLVYLMTPLLTDEIKQLGNFLPIYLNGINNFLNDISQLAVDYNFSTNLQQVLDDSSSRIGQTISSLFSNTLSLLSSLFKVVIVVSLSFYMLVKKNGTRNLVKALTPRQHQHYAIDLVRRIQTKMGRWLIGQITLIVIIFALDYLVLTIFQIPFALILAIWGGLLEIIPYIGPTLAIIPAALVALTISPWAAISVVVCYVLIQQLENHIFTPLVMKKAVGLNPVIIILALLIGAKLAGVLGVILAVPVATAIGVFVGDLLEKKEQQEEERKVEIVE